MRALGESPRPEVSAGDAFVKHPVLGVVGSAAEGVEALRVGLVEPAMERGWRVAVTLTPTAGQWLRAIGEIARLEKLTGLPVRDAPRLPGEARPHPAANCYVMAPASANTVAKLALGLMDNQALTQVGEAIGTAGLPVIVLPRVNAGHTGHPAWHRHIETLKAAGVHLVHGPKSWSQYEAVHDGAAPDFPWSQVLAAVSAVS
ncbi:flavoprotein [Streptomyces sp. NPDC051993]|uniref:flavoprotein n=1 Tax=Streptomyces sp. NPDC051993 TaxID=3155286 RepID=UPI003414A00E